MYRAFFTFVYLLAVLAVRAPVCAEETARDDLLYSLLFYLEYRRFPRTPCKKSGTL